MRSHDGMKSRKDRNATWPRGYVFFATCHFVALGGFAKCEMCGKFPKSLTVVAKVAQR
jgi:hypothetical protein